MTRARAFHRRLAGIIAAAWLAPVVVTISLPAQAAAAPPPAPQASAPPELRRLFVGPSGDIVPEGASDIQLAPGLPIDHEALQHALNSLLGQPIGRALQAEIRRVITGQYVTAGRPFIDIVFPPQDITDGSVHVQVTEYRVGRVSVSGNHWYSDSQIDRAAGLRAGETIDMTRLNARLAGFGASPFVKVTPEFAPGAAPGTTDVRLLVVDRLPVQVSAAYRNNGAAATGWDRYDLGARWGDVFHTGASLGYTLSSSSDFFTGRPGSELVGDGKPPRFLSQQVNFILPLDGGDQLSLSGADTRQSPALGPDLGSLGVTTQFTADYTRPVVGGPLSRLGGEDEEIGVSADYKRTNNNLSFGGLQVQRGFTVIGQVSLRAGAAFPHRLGRLQVSNVLTASPGGLTRDNSDRAFQPSGTAQSGTPGAHARYAYDRLTFTNLTPLPNAFGLVLRATLQAASGTLLASEQLSIAGMDAVRGYQEFGVAGSQGVIGTAELRTPSFRPSLWFGGTDLSDQAQLRVFADAGRAWNPTGSQTAPAAQGTASLGVGGTLAVADALTVRIDQGWQLIRTTRQGAKGAFLHAEVIATW